MGRNNSYHRNLINSCLCQLDCGEAMTKPTERDLEKARELISNWEAVRGNLRLTVAQALADQREECAKIADIIPNGDNGENYIAQAIRTGGKS